MARTKNLILFPTYAFAYDGSIERSLQSDKILFSDQAIATTVLIGSKSVSNGSGWVYVKADDVIRLSVLDYAIFDPQITSYFFKISKNRQFPVFTGSACAGLKSDRKIKLSRFDYLHKDLKIRSKNRKTDNFRLISAILSDIQFFEEYR